MKPYVMKAYKKVCAARPLPQSFFLNNDIAVGPLSKK